MDQTPAPKNPDFQVTSFESQTADEQVLAVLRSHVFNNFSWVSVSTIMAIVPLIAIVLGISFGAGKFLPLTFTSVLGLLVIWYLLVFAFAYQSFLTWYFNLYIVTNHRVIDTDFLPLFYQKVASCELNKIEDTTVSMSGFFQSAFNYGNILIQTAGEQNEFEFVKVPDPETTQKLIEGAIDQKNGSQRD